MQSIERFPKTLDLVVLSGVVLAGTLGMAVTAAAQDVSDLQTPNSPLVLKAQGSFVVGGQVIAAQAGDLGTGAAPGHVTIKQLYVQFMIPQGATKVPVVMVHGGGLSGKSFETTPDGRMGWNEYFVRQGHPVYNADQVSRARSGFDQTIINRVHNGSLPPSALFNISRTSDEAAWQNFRFGPSFGVPWPDEQFPVEHAADFSRQGIPDLNASLTPSTTTSASSADSYQILASLAIKLKGAVLMGHSESSDYTLRAILTDPTGIKGAIFLETTNPSRCLQFSDAEIKKLAAVPILFEFNDHLDQQPAGVLASFNNCKALVGKINAAGGNATMLHPADLGIHGNSHMVMLDKNNLQIADLILKWLDDNVGGKTPPGHQ
jgi:pimeloyl-ACP methyl ester carboxylesterase